MLSTRRVAIQTLAFSGAQAASASLRYQNLFERELVAVLQNSLERRNSETKGFVPTLSSGELRLGLVEVSLKSSRRLSRMQRHAGSDQHWTLRAASTVCCETRPRHHISDRAVSIFYRSR